MLAIPIGALRHQIKIEKATFTTDSAGGQVIAWAPFGSAWASIETLSGQRLIAAQALVSEVTHEIRIRYLTTFSNPVEAVKNYRIKWGSRIFDLCWVNNVDERNILMLLQCSEGVVRV